MEEFSAVIKTRPVDRTFNGFEGNASYKFIAELKFGDNFLGEKEIIINGRPSFLDNIIPGVNCILFLTSKCNDLILQYIKFLK